jgi:hypothetical protein
MCEVDKIIDNFGLIINYMERHLGCRLIKNAEENRLLLLETEDKKNISVSDVDIRKPYHEINNRLAVLDGFIDLLYYIHFYLYRRHGQSLTALGYIVREFAEQSDPVNYDLPAKVLSKTFIFEMVISEMCEVLISFTDGSDTDYISLLMKCIDCSISIDPIFTNMGIDVEQVVSMYLTNEFGYKWVQAFLVVHNANMLKRVDGKFIYNSDGKIIKPQGWTAPDITLFI